MSVDIKTKSFKLSAYIKGSPDAKKLAIVCPGMLNSKDHPHIREHVEFLASIGFLSVAIDPPGTWGSLDSQTYTVSNYLNSAMEVIKHFGNRPTLMVGHSLGGSVAMLAASKSQSVAGLVAIMSNPSYSGVGQKLDEWHKQGFKIFKCADPVNKHVIREYKLPYSFVADASKLDATEKLVHLKLPKLFIAGEQDLWITKEMVESAFKTAAAPKDYVLIRAAHNYSHDPEAIREINQKIEIFIKKYII